MRRPSPHDSGALAVLVSNAVAPVGVLLLAWSPTVFGTETLQFDTDVESTPDVQFTVPDPEEVDGDDANANHPLEIPHVEDAAAVLEAFGVNRQATQGADRSD